MAGGSGGEAPEVGHFGLVAMTTTQEHGPECSHSGPELGSGGEEGASEGASEGAAVFSRSLIPETSVDRFKDACRKAGIGEGKPLYTAMMMVFVAAEQAEHAARVGARGLTPDGETEIIDRVVRSVDRNMRDGLHRVRLRLERRAAVLTGVGVIGAFMVGLVSGYGYRYVEENRFSNMVLQQIRDLCVGEAVWPSNGGLACSVRLWLEPPVKGPER